MTTADARVRLQHRHDPLEGKRADGTITTGAQRNHLSIPFRPVLDKAIEHLLAIDGAASLYVYGSVATGSARVGTSDVELATIGLDASRSRELAASLSAEFSSLCRGVEIGSAQPCDYEGSGDEAYGNRVFLRHYCVHLAGPDLRQGLPEYPADRAAARGFNGDIGLRADGWRSACAGAGDLEPAVLARRIARKTLFAVAGMVSLHDSTWTTDRLAAAERFALIEPRLAAALAVLATWSTGDAAPPSHTEVRDMLDGAVAHLVDEFARRIGLWSAADPTRRG